MIILLDTSTSICKLTIVHDNSERTIEWEANRSLADGLLGFLLKQIEHDGKQLTDISGFGIMKGPGSFTGLRIGMTICNVLAQDLKIPIVGETGDDWQKKCLTRLSSKENDTIVLPEYSSEAIITKPRK